MTLSSFSKLFQKYNIPGPRYTSYPTVPYWELSKMEETLWIEELKTSLLKAQKRQRGIAMYLHIPFCISLCTYCACNNRITRNLKVSKPYIETLLKEWDLYRAALDQETINMETLHLGGGTPTFFSPEELQLLLPKLYRTAIPMSDFEGSIEVDPRVTTLEHLETLFQLRFQRLSLGIQDFDPKVQETVHRIQSFDQVRVLVEQARSIGYKSINFDLIYGLPFQKISSIEDTMEKVLKLKPERIAFYSYAHVPWIRPGQRRFTEADLPSGAQKQALYETGRALLEKGGYLEIGMDHFALPEDDLSKALKEKKLFRNFMGYLPQHSFPLIALGVSSISDAWTMFSQNEKLLERYTKKVQENTLPLLRGHLLSQEDLFLRKKILDLMTLYETTWKDQEGFLDLRTQTLTRLQEPLVDQLLTWNPPYFKVLPQGKPFIRNICMAFDAKLARHQPKHTIFSKTI